MYIKQVFYVFYYFVFLLCTFLLLWVFFAHLLYHGLRSKINSPTTGIRHDFLLNRSFLLVFQHRCSISWHVYCTFRVENYPALFSAMLFGMNSFTCVHGCSARTPAHPWFPSILWFCFVIPSERLFLLIDFSPFIFWCMCGYISAVLFCYIF